MKMKNDKKLFILIEAVLAVMVIMLVFVMLAEKSGRNYDKVSVMIQNPDDSQWAAFRYGLEMAAEDQELELVVCDMEGVKNAGEVKEIIEKEIERGADAVILQPFPGSEMGMILKKFQKKVPVMLVESMVSEEGEQSAIPVSEPDNYAMGKALAEELLRDHNGKVSGKTIGILSENEDTEAFARRRQGFADGIEGTGAEIRWMLSGTFAEENFPENQTRTDFVIALDNNSLTRAGENSAANNLHGALVYGIGNSTDAFYYLDTGFAECILVPEGFNIGYQSLTEVARSIRNPFYTMRNQTVSHTVIRREELFSEKNQEILFEVSR